VAHVLAVGKRLGLPVGIHCGSVEAVNQRIAEGFLWLALSTDAGFLAEAALRAFQRLDTPAAAEAQRAARRGVAE